jgi:GC-rich sequence DNA-binding factor
MTHRFEVVLFSVIPHVWDGALQSEAEPNLGDVTTDESDGEVSHYSARRKEILDNAATVFADASEEFATLPTVKKRLEAWKAAQAGELVIFQGE